MFDAQDRRFMKIAISLAAKGLGVSSPNPSVGCVLVRDGRIVGRGFHAYALRDHAEVHALREAAERARGATAYVTLEPCCHRGRTPPCADALIRQGVRRVVVARPDPNPRVSGGGIERLRASGIRVDVGLMAEEAGRLIDAFACRITTGLPLVVAKAGMSLDGKIGTGHPGGRWITSPESREFGQRLRLAADALLVGIRTVLADDPELTYRGSAPRGRALTRVILDSRLRTPPSARLLSSRAEGPVLIFTRRGAPAKRRGALEARGADIVAVPHSKGGLDLASVLRELGRRDILGVLVEGGGGVHWSFISGGFVDVFYCIIAPLVLGGAAAVPAVGGTGFRTVEEASKLRIRRTFPVGPDIVLEAYPSGSRSIVSPWQPSGNSPSDGQCPARTSARR